MIKLDIGGGTYKHDEDYTSVDLQGADVIAKMWSLPFENDSIDFIWSSHTLEHSGLYKVSPSLKEWLRVLKPGHQAIIQVPDFDYVAKYWLTGSDRPWAEAMVFGHQAHDGEYHKCAFTTDSLRADLVAAGFEVVRIEMRWSHNQDTLQAVCRKPIEMVA
jgi:predicted SAM-dependent methyltransferase